MLAATDLVVRYPGTDPAAHPALQLRGLTLTPGRSLAVVGESGSGKTTALRTLLGLVRPASGRSRSTAPPSVAWGVMHDGRSGARSSPSRRTWTAPWIRARRSARRSRRGGGRAAGWVRRPASGSGPWWERLLDEVGLPASAADRHPHQVSGGQRQRAIIARALAVAPRLLLLDEPTSGLDATVQARILELIERVRAERGLGVLLISHNLGVVARLCPDALVLYRGEVVEEGPTRSCWPRRATRTPRRSAAPCRRSGCRSARPCRPAWRRRSSIRGSAAGSRRAAPRHWPFRAASTRSCGWWASPLVPCAVREPEQLGVLEPLE